MLVKFVSSETGELMMFAEMAGTLLRAVGKETGRRGTFTRDEMLPAAKMLRAAVERGEHPLVRVDDEAVRALDAGEPVAGTGGGQGGAAVRTVHVHPDVELITRIADIGQVVDDPGVGGPR